MALINILKHMVVIILKIDLVTNHSCVYFAALLKNDSVAQLVEQLTLNQWVESSNLSGVTLGC